MSEYPYMVSNNKIAMIFDKILTAAVPEKFTSEFLKKMGFSSSNDRAFTILLKKLNFISSDGTPNSLYSNLKDKTLAKKTIANQIKELYNDLFIINTKINEASAEEIKGAISRVTGREEKEVKRIFSTFEALCAYADFSETIIDEVIISEEDNISSSTDVNPVIDNYTSPSFHYNIQIHLPATSDISVYNAIFKSIKENLYK